MRPDKNISHDPFFFWVPVIFGCIAAALIFFTSAPVYFPIVVSLLTIIIALFIGWRLYRRHSYHCEQLTLNAAETSAAYNSFSARIFPIWARQIDSTRYTGDQAVANLSALFAELVARLEVSLSMSKNAVIEVQGKSKGMLGAIEESKADFQTVITALKAALDAVRVSRDDLMREITQYAATMKDMAADAQLAAMQSRLLSLNAAIEAARAGEAGKSFAAVVVEMRKLATQSAEASAKMSRIVTDIDTAIANGTQDTQQLSDQEKLHITHAEATFEDVVERFKLVTVRFGKSVQGMESDYGHIRDDISSAIVALQFQDRVSQVLTHVTENMILLCNRLDEKSDQALDADAWMVDMESKYTVAEEYGNSRDTQAAPAAPSATTYF